MLFHLTDIVNGQLPAANWLLQVATRSRCIDLEKPPRVQFVKPTKHSQSSFGSYMPQHERVSASRGGPSLGSGTTSMECKH